MVRTAGTGGPVSLQHSIAAADSGGRREYCQSQLQCVTSCYEGYRPIQSAKSIRKVDKVAAAHQMYEALDEIRGAS